MKHVFYALIIFPIIWEMMNVSSPKEMGEKLKLMKGRKFDNMTNGQQAASFFMLFYMVWSVTGLLSFQWPAFAFMLLMGLIPKNYIAVRFFDSLITLAILIFIILNAYHFKIDLFEIIKSNL